MLLNITSALSNLTYITSKYLLDFLLSSSIKHGYLSDKNGNVHCDLSLFLGYPKFNPSRANLINCPLLKYILLFNTTVQGCEVIF